LFAKRNAGQVRRKGFHSLSLAVNALEAGHLDYVLLPMENTIAGSLNETYQMLGERQLSIVDEEILTVEHCLVGLPGTDIQNLSVIRSHPIALQQCSRWLSNLPACVQEGHTCAHLHDSFGESQTRLIGPFSGGPGSAKNQSDQA
jgi:prephenate dehydratase